MLPFYSNQSYELLFLPSASYTVKFYDGVIQTVKGIHVKPFIKEVSSIIQKCPVLYACSLFSLLLFALLTNREVEESLGLLKETW